MFHEELKTVLANVNKTHLSEAIGCHRDRMARWLRGEQVPTVALLVRMCQYLYTDQWEVAYIRWSILLEQQQQ
jgi:transcriptional regulator with XRE-family HTH domain